MYYNEKYVIKSYYDKYTNKGHISVHKQIVEYKPIEVINLDGHIDHYYECLDRLRKKYDSNNCKENF